MKKYTNLNIFVPLGLIIFGIAWLKLAFDMGGAGIGDSSVWVPVPHSPSSCWPFLSS